MLGLLFDIALIAAGAVLVKAWPPADLLATRLRDYLYSLFRKGPADSDNAGA